MNKEASFFERLNAWIRDSIGIKLATIAILIILLIIPTALIIAIIEEREALSDQATQEVSAKWAGAQMILGPILTIPVEYEYKTDDQTRLETRNWYILPNQLDMTGSVTPETLNRGIYEVIVYNSNLGVAGDFLLDHKPDPNHLSQIRYDQAFLTFGISDLKGIENQILVEWSGAQLEVTPGSRIPDLVYSGFTVDLPDMSEQSSGANENEHINFRFEIDLQGSQNLSFVPVGGTTNVNISSAWTSPSFNGNFLPDNRTVDENGFTAGWKVLQLNRNFPQSWTGSNQNSGNMMASAFGVDLILPLDNYQKNMRSAKYAIMTVALTFLIFFLVEIKNKKKIHPFQYTLVGIGLILFYVLLLSISEHAGFTPAYVISAISVIAMISLYGKAVFKSTRISALLVFSLIGIYSFLFIIMQLVDYALLVGSIGLTLILAVTMYLTRKIDWYAISFEPESSSVSNG